MSSQILTSALLAVFALSALGPAVCRAEDGQLPSPSDLRNLSLEQLGNVEVVTENKEATDLWHTPAALYVLRGDDIRRSGVTSIPDALRLVPGVNVARVNGGRNWVVGIRGLGDQFSRYVEVLIDGRSIYTPLFGGVYWTIDNVAIEDIDRIEVIRGPGGTIWGSNAVNGIINIITKSAADTQGALVALGGGNVDQTEDTVRYGSKRGKVAFREYAFGFVRSPEYHINGQPAYDDSRLGQLGFRLDRTTPRDELTFQGDGYLARIGDAQNISTYNPPVNVVSWAPTDASGGNLLGRWRRRFSNGSDIYLQGFWSHDHRVGSNFAEDRDTFDLDFLHRTVATHRQQLTYGAGLRVSPSTTNVVVPTQYFTPAHLTGSDLSAFVQDEFTLLPKRVTLTLGSKLERNNYTGFQYQPNGRLLWTPSEHSTVWASISRAVRTPDRVNEDIHVDIVALANPVIYGSIIGNHTLRSERLLAYEGGARFLVGGKLFLSMSAFHNAYGDIIAQGPATVLPGTAPYPPGSLVVQFQYQNGIYGSTNGFELAPDLQVTPWWRLKSSFSYLSFALNDKPGFKSTTTLTTLHGSSPNNQAVFQSRFDLPGRVEFDQTVRYVSALPAQQVKAYVTGDVRAGWTAVPGLDLSIVGQNLFQPHHGEFGIDPAPNVLIKRSIFVKLVWTH